MTTLAHHTVELRAYRRHRPVEVVIEFQEPTNDRSALHDLATALEDIAAHCQPESKRGQRARG